MPLKARFEHGSSTYKCSNCERVTRNTGRGEPDHLCRFCDVLSLAENSHLDGCCESGLCPWCDGELSEFPIKPADVEAIVKRYGLL